MRLIDADALKERFHGVDDAGTFIYVDKLLEAIDNAPIIVPVFEFVTTYEEIPRGKWIKKGVSFAYEDLECSECADCVEHDADDDLPNFCPNCGAPMTEEAYRKYNGFREGFREGGE